MLKGQRGCKDTAVAVPRNLVYNHLLRIFRVVGRRRKVAVWLWYIVVLIAIVTLLAGDTAAKQTTRGRDFYVAYLPNYHNGGDSAPDSLYLFIVADEQTNGTISYTNNLGQTQIQTFSITNPQQIYVHRVQYRQFELFGYNNNGTFVTPNENERTSPRIFRITTDRDVAVYALNQALTTSDATLVLPVTALGTEYYIMSYPSDGVLNSNGTLNSQYTPSQFVVVGVEDGTDVTIYPTAPTTETGIQVKNIRLNRGQAMLFQAEFSRTNLNYDLTGTRVVATNKVAVFAGHQRALLPVTMRGILSSRDHLYEQMIPRSVWGTTYIITPLAEPQGVGTPTQNATDLYRVVAAENNTQLTINGRLVATLQRGQFYQAPLQQPALLEASQPVMVALFKRSFSVGSTLQLGDPFMMIIPPRRQYLSRYRFQSCQVTHPSGGNTYFQQFITVVTTPNNVDSIRLDGVKLVADFKPVPNTCYVYANLPVTDGAHTIESHRLFGLYVYGYGYADSYGYVGGMAFLPDVTDITMSAGPDRELCEGDSVTLSVIGNASSVQWSIAPGFPQVNIPCDTCHTITITPRATTKLRLVGFDSLGCQVSNDVLITVYGKPQVRIRPDTVVCSDGPVTIVAEGSFQSIQWMPTEGLGCSVCPQTTVTPRPGQEVTYTAVVRSANSEHCEARDSIRVRYAPGLLGKIPPVVALCQGDSLTLTVDYGGTVRWMPAQGISCTDCKTITFRPQRTTRYTVIGDSAGCTTQASVEVRVVQKPTLAPLADTSICAGDALQLQLVATNAEGVSITPAIEVSCTACLTPIFTPTQTRTYTVTVTSGSGSTQCSVSDSLTITVLPRPIIELPQSLDVCTGDTTILRAYVVGADSIRWEPADGIACPTCDTTEFVPTTSGVYQLRAWTHQRCSSQLAIAVRVHQRPSLQLAPLDTAVCAGSLVQLRATSDGTIEWDRSLTIDCDSCSEVAFIATESRRLRVRSRNASGCSTEGMVMLEVRPLPVIELPDSVQLCIGKSIRLHSSGQQPNYRYQWQPSTGLSCTDCPEPIAEPTATTHYVLTTISPYGCLDVDTVVVSVVPCRTKLVARTEQQLSKGTTCDSATFVVMLENPTTESDQDFVVEGIEIAVVNGEGRIISQVAEIIGDGTAENILPSLPRSIRLGERWRYRCMVRLLSDQVILLLRIRSRGGDTIITASFNSTPQVLRAYLRPVATNSRLAPGEPLELSFHLDAERWDVLDIRHFTLQIHYPAEQMYYSGEFAIAPRADITAGRWQFLTQEILLESNQSLVTIVGHGSSPLTSNGELFRLRMNTLLALSYRIEPTIDLLLPDTVRPCIVAANTAESVVLHACAGNLRFVRIGDAGFKIRQLTPNPTSDGVTIEYEVGFTAPVRLELYDAVGRTIRRLIDAEQEGGIYQFHLMLDGLPAGLYWCRYTAPGVMDVQALQVIR